MDRQELNALRSVEELLAYQKEVRGRIVELDTEHAGLPFPDEARDEYAELRDADREIDQRVTELRARAADVARMAQSGGAVERPEQAFAFSTPRSRTEDIYDLSTVRRSFEDPSVEGRELHDRALRAIEGATFPHPEASREDVQGYIERLLVTVDSEDGAIARRLLATGSPTYKRAFGKYLASRPLSTEEQRAMSLTTSSGGYAVPFVLDPTIIPTSNLAVNPFRAISRVEQITVDEWRGVTSAGITAAYGAEATETSDNSPTLVQPTVSTEKAQAFIPFSIEIGMDWNSLQAEMARLLQDAKDELEASKFATGSGTNEPFGVITGATSTVSATTGGAFNVQDVYALETNLGARFRPRASFVMNRAIAQKIRQFDTAGGAQLWLDNLRIGLANQVPTPGSYGDGARVLGYGAYESSAMSSSVTTGQKVLILGDFSYYLIADRVGLSVEVIPHLFGTGSNFPTGQRGLYAYWRNGAKVLATPAFKVLQL